MLLKTKSKQKDSLIILVILYQLGLFSAHFSKKRNLPTKTENFQIFK